LQRDRQKGYATMAEDIDNERWDVLHQLEDWLETPMVVLSFMWFVVVIVELVWGAARYLEVFGTIIWVVFIAEFFLRLVLAPGMNALRKSLGRRGVGYVVATTAVVALLGAAGMLVFEPAGEVEGGFTGYPDALWWTAMLLTTMGSQYWPQTGEGRLLCFLLSLYGFGVFGYITASFASFFVGQEASHDDSDVVGAADVTALRDEIASLRDELRRGMPGR
jgi:voltage-gated potassium channel